MTRKILWLLVSCLMALSLVMAACAPAAAPTTPTTPATPATPAAPTAPTTPAREPPQKEAVAPASGAPKYGGTFTVALTTDPTNFDSGAGTTGGALLNTVYEQYVNNDWRRGPAGSGITNFASGANSLDDYLGPQLAESWQIPQQGVWKLKIREGVRWQQPNTEAGRLMAGRVMTADDIVSSLNRLLTAPVTWMRVSQPLEMAASSVNKTGPWEVTVRTPVGYWTSFVWLIQGAGYNRVYPPEVVARFGNLTNWRNAVGTGPFMLTDYVPGSQLAYIRNPNYWGTNPVGPGKDDKLPYVDAYRELIIPDLSTRTAALRTGKLDFLPGVTLEDWQSLMKTNPKFEYNLYMSTTPWVIGMRQDKKDKPFSDIRVRQALMLATNYESWVNDYYKGKAEINVFPVNKQVTDLYQPLSDMPQAVQDLFKYNPDKAKQLLKEAGYPNGFKSTIVVSSVPQRIDEISVLKDQWAKVGVQLEISVKDTAVYSGLTGANRVGVEEMIYRFLWGGFNIALFIPQYRGPSTADSSFVNDPPGGDPYIESLWPGINDPIFVDMPKVYQAYKKVTPYVLEQAFYIPLPTPYTYNIWWPWLKNFYGQGTGFARYFWINQELKKAMGY
ncbi:MAG: ABC transporter substrate-binding protein [Chloroflexota bacterium]